MAGVTRRTFLHGVAGAAAAGGVRPLWTETDRQAVAGFAETVTRDARLVWRRPPMDWTTAACLGNGVSTVRVQRAAREDALAFRFGDTAAWESAGPSLELVLAGTPTAVDWELDLWDAELTGTVTTTRGSVGLSALVHRDLGALLVSLSPGAGEEAAAWAPTAGVAWREHRIGTRRLLVAATRPSAVTGALAGTPDSLVVTHRAWWHRFHSGAVLSIPDKTMQRFHRVQRYHAAVTPPSVPSPSGFTLPGTGSKSGPRTHPVLAGDLPGRWRNCRHDKEMLRDTVRPALRDTVDFYAEYLVEGADGRLHLPLTHSPEYADVVDCTYDLSILRWAIARLGELDRPAPPRWADLATRLVPYHTDASGVMIGAGVRLAESHRHASHLLWLYPFREKVGLARRSFDHWTSMRSGWHGHSHVTAATMAASLGCPDEALEHLRHFLGGTALLDTELTPNALYRRGSVSDHTVPAAAGEALLEMVVRAGEDGPAAFPAIPASWRDVAVAGVPVPGAGTMDALRRDGRTEWVRITDDRSTVETTGGAVVPGGGAGPPLADVPGEPGARRWGLPDPFVGRPTSTDRLS
ncbi:glycosyl hydrolase family 95 catalytic domain-containing protein [Amycolatopsis samaneae]|uniref:Glycosyl hydrolase family 95 catalytic domain-containing protein n=2 Tax=Amycolatopsis samaneae TaxID=664691 RepID=A0ABW5GRP5_9PSEU